MSRARPAGPMKRLHRCVRKPIQTARRWRPAWGRSRWRTTLWNKLSSRRCPTTFILSYFPTIDARLSHPLLCLPQNREIEELTKICDELIAKLGKIDWVTSSSSSLRPSPRPSHSAAASCACCSPLRHPCAAKAANVQKDASHFLCLAICTMNDLSQDNPHTC